MYLQPPFWIKWIFPELIRNIPTTGNKLYLTFDDGPHPEVTPKVIQLLKKHDAHATFFFLGQQAEKHPMLLEEIKKEGHTMGNHGYLHLDGWKTSTHAYKENIARADKVMGSTLFRPPYGRIKRSQINVLKSNYKIILWDVMSYDFMVASADKCLSLVTRNAKPGSIIVFHDTPDTAQIMLPALEKVITHFKSQGYGFERIE